MTSDDAVLGRAFHRHHAAMLLIDPATGRIVDANASAARFYGYPLDRLRSMGIDEINVLSPEVIAAERRRAEAEERSHFLFPHRLADGSERLVEVHSSPVDVEDRTLLLSIVHDVTAARRDAILAASASRLRATMDSLVDPFLLLRVQRLAGGRLGEIVVEDANRAAARELGRPVPEVVGRRLDGVVPSGVAAQLGRLLVALVEEDRPLVLDGLPFRLRPGEAVRTLDVRGVRVGDGVSLTWRDVTDRDSDRRALLESEERFRLAFEEALTGMALVGVRPPEVGRYLRVNKAGCRFLGRSEEELRELTVFDVVEPEDRPRVRRTFDDLVAGRISGHRAETRYRDASGRLVWGLLAEAVVRDADGTALYMLRQVEDVTARKQVEAELVHRTLHDELTGLPNRTLLLDRLDHELRRARRHGHHVAVLFVDLDDFKAVNDSLGHASGDELLAAVAGRMQDALREADTAGRIGGDEFAVVCGDLAEPGDAIRIAEHLQRAFDLEVPVAGRALRVSASIGVAVSDDTSSPEQLLRDADTAMYRAKRRGGRSWARSDAGAHAAALEVLDVEAALRTALRHDELVVHYQPIVDLRDERIVGLEALLRWQHPERGTILPGEFIDVAERRNLIGALGERALDLACGDLARWSRRGRDVPVVSVNLSVRQLGAGQVARQLETAIDHHHLTADRLIVEVTESQVVGVGSDALAELRRIAELGVRVAIDDFGTGYTGLGYLRDLPVTELKIDRSFVQGMGTTRADTAITTSVVALARELGIGTVAEGVETTAQRAAVRGCGCDWAQGWLWGRAVPPAEIDERLTGP